MKGGRLVSAQCEAAAPSPTSGAQLWEKTHLSPIDEWADCRARARLILRTPAVMLPWVFALVLSIAEGAIQAETVGWVIAVALIAGTLIIIAGGNIKLWIILYPLVFLVPRFKLGDWSQAGETMFGLQLYDPWILLLLCLWVPKLIATKRLELPRVLLLMLLALLVIGLWGIRVAPDRGIAVRVGGRVFFEPILLFALVASHRWQRSELRATILLFICVATIVAGASFFGYWSSFQETREIVRLGTYWEADNSLAAVLVGTIPLALGTALASFGITQQSIVLVALPTMIVGLVLTFTRGAWIAIMASCGLMFSVIREWLWPILAVLLVLLMGLLAPRELVERAASILSYHSDPSASARLVLWPKVVRLILDRPLTGYGFAGFQVLFSERYDILSEHAHNVFLDFALSVGIPGLVVVLLVIGYVLGRTFRAVAKTYGASQDTPILIGLGAGCAGMLLAGMTDGSIPIWPVLAQAFWFNLALAYAMTTVVQGDLTRFNASPAVSRR